MSMVWAVEQIQCLMDALACEAAFASAVVAVVAVAAVAVAAAAADSADSVQEAAAPRILAATTAHSIQWQRRLGHGGWHKTICSEVERSHSQAALVLQGNENTLKLCLASTLLNES
jgi:hypothetical protein